MDTDPTYTGVRDVAVTARGTYVYKPNARKNQTDT